MSNPIRSQDSRARRLARLAHQIEHWLSDPFFPVTAAPIRRRIQLLAWLLLCFGAFTLLGLVLTPLSGYPGRPAFYNFLWGMFLIVIPLYLLSRTRLYRVAIGIALTFMSAFPFIALIQRGDYSADRVEALLLWLVIGFLLSVSMLPMPNALLLIGANLTAVLLLPVLFPMITYAALTPALGFLGTAGALILANVRYREWVAQDRRDELLGERNFADDIINGLPGVFIMCDRQGQLIRWNKRTETLTGFAAHELTGLALTQLVSPDHRSTIAGFIDQVYAGVAADIEVELVSKSGARLPHYLTARLGSAGAQVYWLGFGIDVSESRRAEQALRESENLYRRAIEAIGGVPYLHDQQTQRYTFMGEGLRQLTGFPVEEFDPRSWLALVQELVPLEANGLSRAQAAERSNAGLLKTWLAEMQITTRNEQTRWLLDSAVMIFDANGLPRASIGILQDITERKRAEQERERLIAELEARNAELERFVYTVSHDLKSPLITIQGFLGYVEQDARTQNWARLQADLVRIATATRRMQRLLNDVLELSRVGRVSNPPVDTAFGNIVQQALEALQVQMEQRGVRVEIAPNLPHIRGDEPRLIEVVQNLVENAVKFMGDQVQPLIEIGMRDPDKDGKPIFFVRDNGIGIEPEYHQRIFGLFNRLDPHIDGTGVGLTLAERIVQVHGGRIWVESEGLGKGATFCFTLPGV